MKIYSHNEIDKTSMQGKGHGANSVTYINRINQPYTLDTDSFSIEVDPIERTSYQGVAETASFGALTLARVDTSAAVVRRNPDTETEPDFRRFSFIFVIKGSLNIGHHLGMSKLKAGEFILLDNSHPRTMFVYDQVSLLLVNLPRQMLLRYVPVPEELEALVLSDRQSDRREPLFAPLLLLWDHLRKGALRDFAPDISDEFLLSIARSYAAYCKQQGSVRGRRITEACQYIEAQLGNPELTVESIARGLGVCTRYIRFLFKDTEKPSQYILRRRLEESANQLTNVLNQNLSIATIAYRCGFNSAAHFSRAFHGHYGTTPRDYRRKNLVDHDNANPGRRRATR
jgi:AraC family transcriptional activator of tynA and feaB